MAFLVIKTWVPLHKVLDVLAKNAEEVKKFDWLQYGPLIEKDKHGELIRMTITRLVKEGAEVIQMLKIVEGKLEDAMKRQVEYSAKFKNIKGFSTQMEVYYGQEELAAIAGVEIPEGLTLN